MTNGTKKYLGGCHCGAVRFEVELDLSRPGSRCNCTLCMKMGKTGAIAKPDAFRLLSGEEALSDYQWGMKVGTARFCKHCGIHAFGLGNLPQLGGAYVSIALNCLDDVDVATLDLIHFDGRHNNWMAGPRKAPWPVHVTAETSAAPPAAS